MDFFSSFLNFAIENFKIDNESDGESLKDKIMQKYVEKMFFGENILLKLGFPFKVKNNSISNLKINGIDEENEEEDPKLEIKQVFLQIYPFNSEETSSRTENISINAEILIDELKIEFLDNNNFPILCFCCENVKADIKRDDISTISLSNLVLMSKEVQIFEISQIIFNVKNNFHISANIDEIDINSTKDSFKDTLSLVKDSNIPTKIIFNVKKLNFKLNTSATLIFNYFSLEHRKSIKITSDLVNCNFSSYKFDVKKFTFHKGISKFNDILFNSNSIKIEKLGGEDFFGININNQRKIELAPFRITLPLKELVRSKSLVVNNAFISLLKDLVFSGNFSLAKTSVEVSIIVDKDSVQLKQNVEIWKEGELLKVALRNMEMRVNGGYPVYENHEIFIEDGQQIIAAIKNIDLMLLTSEIKPIVAIIKELYKLQLDLTKKSINVNNLNSINIELCGLMESVGKRPIFNLKAELELINFFNKETSTFLNLKTFVTVYYINYGTSKNDVIISRTPVNAMLPLSANVHELSLETGKVNAFLWMNILEILKGIMNGQKFKKALPILIVNETNNEISVETDKGDKYELKTQQKAHTDCNSFTLRCGDYCFSSSIKNLSYPIFIWKNCILSVSSKETVKYIRLTTLYTVENRVTASISLYKKGLIKSKLLASLSPESRTPINPLEPGESYTLCIGNQFISKAHTFEIELEERKSFLYTINGPNFDISAFISIFKDSVTKTIIILIQPNIVITNLLHKEIVFGVTDLNASKLSQRDKASSLLLSCESTAPAFTTSLSKEIELRVSDPSNGICSKGVIINLAEEESHNELQLGDDILSIKLKNQPDSLSNIIIYGDTLVKNDTLQDLELISKVKSYIVKAKTNQILPTNRLSLKTISLGSVPIQISSNSYTQQKNISYDENYNMVVSAYTSGMTKIIVIKDTLVIKNETDKEIKLIGKTEQIINTNEESALRLDTSEKGCFVLYDGFKSTGTLSFTSICSTTIQLLNEDESERIFLDITTTEKDKTLTTTIEKSKFPPRFSIINETDFTLFAQQTEDIIPLQILPHSTSIFGFDAPEASNSVILTMEGVSANVDYSHLQFNSIFPCKIRREFVYVSVMSESNGSRVIKVKNTEEKVTKDVSIRFSIPSINLTLLKSDMKSLVGIHVNDAEFTVAVSHLTYLSKIVVKSLQIDDHDNKKVIFSGLDKVFFDAAMQFSRFTASITSLTQCIVALSRMEFVCPETTLYSLLQFYNIIKELIKLEQTKANIFIINSTIGPFNLNLNIDNAVDGSTRQISGLRGILPLYASYHIPGFSVQSISGPLSVIEKFITNTVNCSIYNTIRKLHQLSNTSAKITLFKSLISNYEQKENGTVYNTFNPLDKQPIAFSGFINDATSKKEKINIKSKVKIYKLQDTKDNEIELKFAISNKPIVTPTYDFVFGKVVGQQKTKEEKFATDKAAKAQKRGQFLTFYEYSDGEIGFFSKCIVIYNNNTKKMEDFTFDKFKVVSRSEYKINVCGFKEKEPSFSIIMNSKDDAESIFNIFNSISIATNNEYNVKLI